MRHLGAALAMMLGGCGVQQHNQFAEPEYRSNIVEIAVPDGWQPNEVLRRAAGDSSGGHRDGVTPDGLDYRYYSDLTGHAGGWSVKCEKDKMTDETNCHTTDPEKKLFIFMRRGKLSYACVIGHDFPGRDAMMRVDEKPPINAGRKGCLDWSKISGLTRGSNVTVRYWTFPYDYSRDAKASLVGLNSAVGLAEFLYKNRETISF